jgi:soluble lytic murein transglycosylase-like protein
MTFRLAGVIVLTIFVVPATSTERESSTQAAPTSLEKQRQSIERQLQSVARQVRRSPLVMRSQFDGAPAPSVCEKVAPSQIATIVDETAARHSVSSALIRAVIQQESGGNSCAVSPKGALGLMQIMPGVAQEYRLLQPFDPVGNVDTGVRVLKQPLARFTGNLPLTLAAYNAGSAAVERAGGVPDYPETREYVASVLEALGQ